MIRGLKYMEEKEKESPRPKPSAIVWLKCVIATICTLSAILVAALIAGYLTRLSKGMKLTPQAF
jgi:preprotein translocase subunit Sec61beta